MEEGHLGRDSLVGVQGSHPLEEVDFELVEAWSVLLHWDASELGERRLEVGQL